MKNLALSGLAALVVCSGMFVAGFKVGTHISTNTANSAVEYIARDIDRRGEVMASLDSRGIPEEIWRAANVRAAELYRQKVIDDLDYVEQDLENRYPRMRELFHYILRRGGEVAAFTGAGDSCWDVTPDIPRYEALMVEYHRFNARRLIEQGVKPWDNASEVLAYLSDDPNDFSSYLEKIPEQDQEKLRQLAANIP